MKGPDSLPHGQDHSEDETAKENAEYWAARDKVEQQHPALKEIHASMDAKLAYKMREAQEKAKDMAAVRREISNLYQKYEADVDEQELARRISHGSVEQLEAMQNYVGLTGFLNLYQNERSYEKEHEKYGEGYDMFDFYGKMKVCQEEIKKRTGSKTTEEAMEKIEGVEKEVDKIINQIIAESPKARFISQKVLAEAKEYFSGGIRNQLLLKLEVKPRNNLGQLGQGENNFDQRKLDSAIDTASYQIGRVLKGEMPSEPNYGPPHQTAVQRPSWLGRLWDESFKKNE